VVRDVETGAEHRLAGGTADKRAYAAALAEWRSEVAHACAQRSVPLVDASTHLSLRTLIREVLPRAGVLERAR
jgi:hypothetical protein